jgi:hypothetical protein
MAHAALGQALDPRLDFRTITTEHFFIYYHQGEEAQATRLSVIAEETRSEVARALRLEPPPRTHVILADQAEISNGFANPLPYGTIALTAATPSASEFVGRADDWLRLVFTHEYTHIIHLDRSEGWARLVRQVFGRTPIAFLSDIQPNWQIEGLAEWQESRLTGGGRLYAGDFQAITGEAARNGRFEPVDRVNGGLTDWPGGSAQYAYGLGFVEYLAERFGEGRFGELILRTARAAPFFGPVVFRNMFGLSLPDAWHDYQLRAEREASAIRPGTDTPAPVRLTQHGNTVLGPRYAPPSCAGCAAEIIYSVRGPEDHPALYAIGTDGTAPRRLERRTYGSTSAPTARLIVFDQQEARRNAALYSDLYWIDRRSHQIHEMTHEQRLQDPDLSPDGRFIVCVRESRGRRDLVLVELVPDSLNASSGPRVGSISTILTAEETQFNAPRWSPDGQRIVVARHRLGTQSDIIVVNIQTHEVRVVAGERSVRFVTPTWAPDGRRIVAAADFDGGPFNLFEFDVDRPDTPPRVLTQTTGGALWPDVSADGRSIVFSGYTVEGFDLFVTPYAPGPPRTGAAVVAGEPALAAVPVNTTTVKSAPYSPWQTLAPTAWAPTLDSDGATVRLGASTGGTDVLARHAYTAGVSWIVSKPDDLAVASRATPDWNINYSYGRWMPRLSVSASSETLLFRPSPAGFPLGETIRERQFEAGVFLPILHTRASHRLVASIVHVADDYEFPRVISRQRNALRFGGSRTTAQNFGYSISPERGLAIGSSAEVNIHSVGATAEGTTYMLDGRAYVPGFAAHHVLAMRGGVGYSTGAPGRGRTFLLGGAGPNSDVVAFSSEAFSLNRGFAPDTFGGPRIAIVNADYRWPIARPQRGVEAYPFFLHTVHAAVFADAGQVWSTDFSPGDLKTSMGGEVAADVVIGFNLKFTVAAGAAWGHDYESDQSANHAAAYLRIGKAF